MPNFFFKIWEKLVFRWSRRLLNLPGPSWMDPGSKYGSRRKSRILTKNVTMSRFLCMHKILVHAQESCACTRLLCMQKILVHAQDSCACTKVLCMHKSLVHAQESCACTRFLRMHKSPVHAQDSCACTRFLFMHTNLVHAQELLRSRESCACTAQRVFHRLLVLLESSMSGDNALYSARSAIVISFDVAFGLFALYASFLLSCLQ